VVGRIELAVVAIRKPGRSRTSAAKESVESPPRPQQGASFANSQVRNGGRRSRLLEEEVAVVVTAPLAALVCEQSTPEIRLPVWKVWKRS
jgi:hypothetical protein